tara:strand:+ start:182 stop:649 length:468 start_codon:yes stop_codon:yes gene_type:complete
MIEQYDNFLSTKDLERVIEDTNDVQWRIQTSNGKGLDFLEYDVTDQEYYNSYLKGQIDKVVKTPNRLERIYFNGQWPGRDGTVHIDNCEQTVLLYIVPCLPEWGGFTQLLQGSEQIIIPPVQNRLIVFDGNIPHKGYSFSHQACPMRITLAFKLK